MSTTTQPESSQLERESNGEMEPAVGVLERLEASAAALRQRHRQMMVLFSLSLAVLFVGTTLATAGAVAWWQVSACAVETTHKGG